MTDEKTKKLLLLCSESLEWALSCLSGGPDDGTPECKRAYRVLGIIEGLTTDWEAEAEALGLEA